MSVQVQTTTGPAATPAPPPANGAAPPPAAGTGNTALGGTDAPAPDSKGGAAAPAPGTAAAPGDQQKDGQPGTAAPADLEIKLPDGVKADEAMLSGFKQLAKESGLKGEVAQKVVDMYVAAQQAAEKKAVEAYETERQGWAKALETDKEFGGKDMAANKAIARKAVAKYGTPELRQLFEETGLGNHPELVRFFYRVGKADGEDTVTVAAGAAGGEQTEEQKLRTRYPSMFPKE